MKLVKDNINEQLYRIIKEKILLTELNLGQQINPRELAEQFNVSVMPVRDALFKLVNEGLVENKARVGFFVSSFTKEDIRDIMEVRKLYELYCLDTYFHHIDRTQLKACLKRSENQATMSRREFDALDEQIHDLFIQASTNRYLMNNYDAVKNRIIILRHMDRDQVDLANREHIELLKAILDEDKTGAVQTLRRHIERVTGAIL